MCRKTVIFTCLGQISGSCRLLLFLWYFWATLRICGVGRATTLCAYSFDLLSAVHFATFHFYYKHRSRNKAQNQKSACHIYLEFTTLTVRHSDQIGIRQNRVKFKSPNHLNDRSDCSFKERQKSAKMIQSNDTRHNLPLPLRKNDKTYTSTAVACHFGEHTRKTGSILGTTTQKHKFVFLRLHNPVGYFFQICTQMVFFHIFPFCVHNRKTHDPRVVLVWIPTAAF